MSLTRPALWIFVAALATACTEYDVTSVVAPADGAIDEGEDAGPIGEAGENPVAVCGVNPESVAPPMEEATFQGSDSYDPVGRALVNYEWTLVAQPNGSAASFDPSDNPNRKLTADLAGTYRAQLIVVTEDGRRSEPCETVLSAIPQENLVIEMYWQYAGDDMDLHLLAPGGAMWSNKDCHWMNCDFGGSLDWGTQGNRADDPALDLDDIAGVGPENVNIQMPAAGQYTVVVDDYPGSVFNGANNVTVNIYVDGDLKWTGTKSVAGEDNDAYFAKVTWPGGIVTPM